MTLRTELRISWSSEEKLKLSSSKTKYLKCEFSKGEGGSEDEVSTGGVAIPRIGNLRYLGSIIQEKLDIDKDINHQIMTAWQN